MNPSRTVGKLAKWSAAGVGVGMAAYATYAGVKWLQYGHVGPSRDDDDQLLDEFMPTYDVVDRHHTHVEAPADVTEQLKELSRELDSDQLRTQAVVSIDSTSRIREGREAEFWLDTRKVHVFDPKTGENLTRDAEAGRRLTEEAAEDRIEQVERAKV